MSDNGAAKFLEIAGNLGMDDGPFSEALKEPWPKWLGNVVGRLARMYAPEMTVSEYKSNPEKTLGYAAGMEFILAKAAEGVDLSELPGTGLGPVIKDELNKLSQVEAPQIRETVAAACDLPFEKAVDFFGGFADALKRNTAFAGMEALEQLNALQICFFLVGMRPLIEGGKFRSVAQLFRQFEKVQELNPSKARYFKENPEAWERLKRHFERICSDEGVKLRGRGRPSGKSD